MSRIEDLLEELPTFIAYNTRTGELSEKCNSLECEKRGYLMIVRTDKCWEVVYGKSHSEDLSVGLSSCNSTLNDALEDMLHQVEKKVFNKQ